MPSPTSPTPPSLPLEETSPDGPRGQETHVHAPHAGENRSDSSPPSSYMHPPTPDSTEPEPEPTTPNKATFTTNIRPYSASGVPSPPRLASSTRPTAGPSISTRTSFTRVETEDEQAHQTPFPARPATASAASSSSAGAFGLGFGIFGGGYGGYGRYGGNGKERLTDVVSTAGSGEGGDNEYDDEDAQEPGQQDKPLSPSHSTATSPTQDQQLLTAADSVAEALVPASVQQAPVPQDPQAYITFLLVSGCRRTMSFEPETTVGRVKELVWNTWPEDEEWRKDRPPAPSFLRLLYLGRLLQDDDTLTKFKVPLSYSTFPQPTIVHLSIRPYAPPNGAENSENLNKKIGRFRDGDDPSWNCCRCIIC